MCYSSSSSHCHDRCSCAKASILTISHTPVLLCPLLRVAYLDDRNVGYAVAFNFLITRSLLQVRTGC
ncbi:hypothetical protein CY34DRAFT_707696 [Suillus luteus UH-Slu-Lm8-n1]|uniref:Uncharacterized protein n=1 Tax=Suillus luteus UH-Slu-Lm8-n1 TaxID=930992 RepID=A0A0D0B0G8_9AGAM|nr:hypothetical protein CY34DRAFT_707696 [Suillus luteus UH-Slu-Lm8-n1]